MKQQGSSPPVLITGSSGYIGARLVREFARDRRVIGLDKTEPKKSGPEIVHVGCDFTEDASVEAAFRSVRKQHGPRLASVLHLAAYYDFSGAESPLYRDLTVEGTRRLLRGLRSFDVEQVVFSSTMLVQKPAEQKGEKITEAAPLHAAWDYPRSKLAAETVLRHERGEIPVVVLRIAGVYDEGCHSIPLAQQIRRIREKTLESHFFPGRKDHGQSYVHLEDLAACFRLVVERRGRLEPYEVFLVGEPEVMSYEALQDRLGELIHGREWLTLRIPKLVAKAGAWVQERTASEGEEPFIRPWMIDLADDHYAIGIGRAAPRLGWRPRHRLAEELAAMVKRMREDPPRWYREHDLPLPD